jgi:hypothetical protein
LNFYLSDNALLLWRIDSLLGKDLETKNETTAAVMQQRGVHASTKIVTGANDVFFVVRAEELTLKIGATQLVVS